MVKPLTQRERVAVITYAPGYATGKCEVAECEFSCRADVDGMVRAVEQCRKILTGHMKAHKQFPTGKYYFDLIGEGVPYVGRKA